MDGREDYNESSVFRPRASHNDPGRNRSLNIILFFF